MSKELEALEEIRRRLINDDWLCEDNTGVYEKEYANIEKAIKALEIIKNKKVNIDILKQVDNVELYNKCIHYLDRQLTQEEFDLLKEVLL